MRVINLFDPFAVDQDLLKSAPKLSYQWTSGANFADMPSMDGFRLSNQLALHCAPLTRLALLQRRLTDGATAPRGRKHFHGHSPRHARLHGDWNKISMLYFWRAPSVGACLTIHVRLPWMSMEDWAAWRNLDLTIQSISLKAVFALCVMLKKLAWLQQPFLEQPRAAARVSCMWTISMTFIREASKHVWLVWKEVPLTHCHVAAQQNITICFYVAANMYASAKRMCSNLA